MSTELNVTESRLSILCPVKSLVIYNSLVGTVNEELSRRTEPKDQSFQSKSSPLYWPLSCLDFWRY